MVVSNDPSLHRIRLSEFNFEVGCVIFRERFTLLVRCETCSSRQRRVGACTASRVMCPERRGNREPHSCHQPRRLWPFTVALNNIKLQGPPQEQAVVLRQRLSGIRHSVGAKVNPTVNTIFPPELEFRRQHDCDINVAFTFEAQD